MESSDKKFVSIQDLYGYNVALIVSELVASESLDVLQNLAACQTLSQVVEIVDRKEISRVWDLPNKTTPIVTPAMMQKVAEHKALNMNDDGKARYKQIHQLVRQMMTSINGEKNGEDENPNPRLGISNPPLATSSIKPIAKAVKNASSSNMLDRPSPTTPITNCGRAKRAAQNRAMYAAIIQLCDDNNGKAEFYARATAAEVVSRYKIKHRVKIDRELQVGNETYDLVSFIVHIL